MLLLLISLNACLPRCNPAVVQAGFVARISQEQPLTVSYQERIPLVLRLQPTSRLLNHQGKSIAMTQLHVGQRVWLRGDLLAGYPQEVAVIELRVLHH